MQQCLEEYLWRQQTEAVDDWHVTWAQQTVIDEARTSEWLCTIQDGRFHHLF